MFRAFFVVFIIQGDADLRNCKLGARNLNVFHRYRRTRNDSCLLLCKKKIRIIYNRMEQLILFGILCLRNEIERELNGKQIKNVRN